jgi:hypothetical protein
MLVETCFPLLAKANAMRAANEETAEANRVAASSDFDADESACDDRAECKSMLEKMGIAIVPMGDIRKTLEGML